MPEDHIAGDIAGMTKAPPFSRRDFMTAAAAAAAGYTLAAGPVRAEAIKTDTAGLVAGDARIPVSGGEMPVYFARPGARRRRRRRGRSRRTGSRARWPG